MPLDSPAVKGYIKSLSPWRERMFVLVLLVPGSVLAVLLWQAPATEPITVSALLVDRILQVLTLFVLPAAVLLLIGGPWWLARVAAVAGMIVSVVLGASTSLAVTQPPTIAWRSALALTTLFAGTVLLVVILRKKLSSAQWTISLVALLSFLPVVQFWHSASFVPAHLNTSVGSTAQIIGEKVEGGGARGVVDINVYNNGDIQALILASESIICFRSGPTEWVEVDQLYKDDACRTDKFFDNLSVLDSHSSWKIRTVFDRPPLPGPEHAIKVVQVV